MEYDSNLDVDGVEEDFDDDFDSDDELDTDDIDLEDDGDADDDPWSWAKDADPEAVKKTWNQYTQTREEVLREKDETAKMRQELEPFMKLRDEILEDPGLVKAIDDYFSNSRSADRELMDVKSELMAVKNQIITERELADVQKWVSEQKYPHVEDSDILKHAVENGIPNLRSAYKDLMFDKLQDIKADKVVNDIKRSKGAKSVKSKKSETGRKQVSAKDIYSMSDEDFIKNYDKLLERLT